MENVRNTWNSMKTLNSFIRRYNTTTISAATPKETFMSRDITTRLASVCNTGTEHIVQGDHNSQFSHLQKPLSYSKSSLLAAVNSKFKRDLHSTLFHIPQHFQNPSTSEWLNERPAEPLHSVYNNERDSFTEKLVLKGSNETELTRKKSSLINNERFSKPSSTYETEGIDEISSTNSAGRRGDKAEEYYVADPELMFNTRVATPLFRLLESKYSYINDSISQSERDITISKAATTESVLEKRVRGHVGGHIEEIPEFPQSIDGVDSDDNTPRHEDLTLEDILRREEEYPSTELQPPKKIVRTLTKRREDLEFRHIRSPRSFE